MPPKAFPASDIPNAPSVTITNDVYIVSDITRSCPRKAVTRSHMPKTVIKKKEIDKVINVINGAVDVATK